MPLFELSGSFARRAVQIEVYLLYKAGGLMTPVGYTKGGVGVSDFSGWSPLAVTILLYLTRGTDAMRHQQLNTLICIKLESYSKHLVQLYIIIAHLQQLCED